MRLFFAIEPTGPVRASIIDVVARAADALGPAASALRLTAKGNLHVTLQFLGEVERPRLASLVKALQSRFALEPFTASLDRFGVFPPSGPPRTIWLGLGSGADAVRQIHAEIGRRLTALAFEQETRPYTPHLTVARLRDDRRGLGSSIRAQLTSIALPTIEWRVTHASLFESDLSGPRPEYKEQGRLELGAGTRM
jgi:2'-5' RNA ligase